MRAYRVHYKLTEWGAPRGVDVLANTKEDAYDRAVYEEIPKREHEYPYSAWVFSVTYQNGNYKIFHTFEGKPY